MKAFPVFIVLCHGGQLSPCPCTPEWYTTVALLLCARVMVGSVSSLSCRFSWVLSRPCTPWSCGEGRVISAFLSLVPMTTISCLLSAVGLVEERPLVAHFSLVSLQDPRLETFPVCLPEFFYLFYNTSGSWPVF